MYVPPSCYSLAGTQLRKDDPVVAVVVRFAMILADLLVIATVWKYTRTTREAAKQAAFKHSLGRILLRNGIGPLYILDRS